MAAILNCAILDSAILHKKELHSFILTELDDGSHLEFCHVGFKHCHLRFKHLVIFSQIHSKTLFLHSDSDSNLFNLINLMMATILNSSILNSAILDSAILHKTLTPTNSICLKVIHSHLPWWWQQSSILPSWILPSWIQPFYTKRSSLIHSDSTWWWQPSWTLPCWIHTLPSWIQTPCYLLSDSLKNTLTPFWLWPKLIQSDSNSFILIQLDDGSHLEFYHLEFCHLGFSHLSFSSQTHSHLTRLVPTICTKKTSLIYSDSTWWWQPSWILPCWIQTPCFLLSDSLKNTLTPFWLWLKLIQSDSNSFILIQLDDGSHLEF